jgi:hypothetical protein
VVNNLDKDPYLAEEWKPLKPLELDDGVTLESLLAVQKQLEELEEAVIVCSLMLQRDCTCCARPKLTKLCRGGRASAVYALTSIKQLT